MINLLRFIKRNPQQLFNFLFFLPLLTSGQELLFESQFEGSAVNAALGTGVATAGDINQDGFADWLAGEPGYKAGSYNKEGRVWIGLSQPDGTHQVVYLAAPIHQANMQFGSAVSTACDINADGFSDIIVGAKGYASGQSAEGAIFVFYGQEDGLDTINYWMLESNSATAMLGYAVAGVGDVNGDGFSDVLAGAPFYESTATKTNEGRVYLYYGSADGVLNTGAWKIRGNASGAKLGFAVHAAGDLNADGLADFAAGAPGKGTLYVPVSGTVQVYYGHASLPYLAASLSSLESYSGFGESICFAGDVNGNGYGDLLIGAPNHHNGFLEDAGGVFLYDGYNLNSFSIPVSFFGAFNHSHLGTDVAGLGDFDGDGLSDIAIGIPGNYTDLIESGRFLLYKGHPSFSFYTSTPLSYYTLTEYNRFGAALSSAGDLNADGLSDLIIGAPSYSNTASLQGSVSIIYGLPSIYQNGSRSDFNPIQLLTDCNGAQFGGSVANAGDVNGDGYHDLLIGSPKYTCDAAAGGAAYLFYGSKNGVNSIPDWSVYCTQPFAKFGVNVSGAGDVNGDGYADFMIAGLEYDPGGLVVVYYGGPDGPTTEAPTPEDPEVSVSPDWYRTGEIGQSVFGSGLAAAGDVNGDGFGDIVLGAYAWDDDIYTVFKPGKGYVFYGSATGLPVVSDSLHMWTVTGTPFLNDNLGRSASGLGDVNGDGFSDILFGAPRYENGMLHEGAVELYYGGPMGISDAIPDWLCEMNIAQSNFGTHVSGAGDLNGDGFGDFIVGSPLAANDSLDLAKAGSAFVFEGAADGPPETDFTNPPPAQYALFGTEVNIQLGHIVNNIGDLNGDGYQDAAIGSSQSNDDRGKVIVQFGSKNGFHKDAIWSIGGEQEGEEFGWGICGGDFNGDGKSDLVIGSQNFNGTYVDQGAVFIFYSGSTQRGGMALQQNPSLPVLSLPANSRISGSTLRLGHALYNPLNLGSASLRWDVIPATTSFLYPDNESYQALAYPVTDSSIVLNQSNYLLSPFPGFYQEVAVDLSAFCGTRVKWRVSAAYDAVNSIDGKKFSPWYYGSLHEDAESGVTALCLAERNSFIQDVNQIRTVQVWPVPTSNTLFIQCLSEEPIWHTLYNLQGEPVCATISTYHSQTVQLQTGSIPSGSYLLRSVTKGGEVLATTWIVVAK